MSVGNAGPPQLSATNFQFPSKISQKKSPAAGKICSISLHILQKISPAARKIMIIFSIYLTYSKNFACSGQNIYNFSSHTPIFFNLPPKYPNFFRLRRAKYFQFPFTYSKNFACGGQNNSSDP